MLTLAAMEAMEVFYAVGFYILFLFHMSIFIVFSYSPCLFVAQKKHFVKRISLAAQKAGIT